MGIENPRQRRQRINAWQSEDRPFAPAPGYDAWVSKRAKLLNKTEAEVRANAKGLQETFGITEQAVMDFVEEVERENSNAA